MPGGGWGLPSGGRGFLAAGGACQERPSAGLCCSPPALALTSRSAPAQPAPASAAPAGPAWRGSRPPGLTAAPAAPMPPSSAAAGPSTGGPGGHDAHVRAPPPMSGRCTGSRQPPAQRGAYQRPGRESLGAHGTQGLQLLRHLGGQGLQVAPGHLLVIHPEGRARVRARPITPHGPRQPSTHQVRMLAIWASQSLSVCCRSPSSRCLLCCSRSSSSTSWGPGKRGSQGCQQPGVTPARYPGAPWLSACPGLAPALLTRSCSLLSRRFSSCSQLRASSFPWALGSRR